MKRIFTSPQGRPLTIFFWLIILCAQGWTAWPEEDSTGETPTIFDDRYMLNGHTREFSRESKEVILAMIKDDSLDPMKMAAAVRVLREKYVGEMLLPEKNLTEKFLLRRLSRAESPFVEVEVMHTLCGIDRYQYFASLVPALIQKMDHYNTTVSQLAYESVDDIIKGSNRTREARYVFNTLRRILFLSRRRLAHVTTPDARLTQKLKLLRWSIKVLGTQELNRLPKEVLDLL